MQSLINLPIMLIISEEGSTILILLIANNVEFKFSNFC